MVARFNWIACAALVAGLCGCQVGDADVDVGAVDADVGIAIGDADAGVSTIVDAGLCDPDATAASCAELVSQCAIISGEVICPCSTDPLVLAVTSCVVQNGPSLLECACFSQYRPCANASSSTGDGGFPRSYDGCGI